MTWPHAFGSAFFLIFIAAMARTFINDEGVKGGLRVVLLSAASGVVMLKYVSGFVGAGDRWADARSRGLSWLQSLPFLQAREVRGLQYHLIRLLHGAVRWLLGNPSPPGPPGVPFGYLRRSAYAGLFWVVVILLLLDLPVGYLVMKALQFPPEKLLITHSALIAITGALLVLALGDRYWLLGSTHSLDERLLRLRLGARFQADIRLTDVSHARVVGVEPRGRRPLLEKVLLVTPLERPNVELTLAPGALDEACWYGSVPAPYQTLRLYVDDPGEFVALLTSASKGRSSEGEAAA